MHGDPKRSRVPEVDKLWLSHYPSGKLTALTDNRVHFANFSPDGRKIAYTQGGTLFVINNDGTNRETHLTGFGPAMWWWTTAGIVFFRNDTLVRYDPYTRQTNRTYMGLQHETNKACGNSTYSTMAFHSSRDGRRMWTMSAYDPSGIDSIYCGVRGYDRGGRAYFHWNADFSSRSTVWRTEWGHGDGMTMDGHLILVELGRHRKLGITRQNGNNLTTLYPYYAYDPPYPVGMESRPMPVSVNNDSVVGARAICTQAGCTKDGIIRFFFYNWRTSQMLGQFVIPDSTDANAIHSYSFWYGTLPSPHGDTPYLRLNTTGLVFVVSERLAAPAQQVTVTNSGNDVLTKVQTTVTPASNWLTVTVEGNGGNTQTISNAMNPANITQDQVVATVKVHGGGAANEVSYTVTAYKASALPAPTNLTVMSTGDSLLDIQLNWQDNATSETGYIIERRTDNGAWTERMRTAANVTGYLDLNLQINAHYEYRVKAFRTRSGLPDQNSDYTNVAGLTVGGIAWIRVHRPMANEFVKKGSTTYIHWTANIIDQVYIEYSTNGGESWETITVEGGIFNTAGIWGNYPWTVPNMDASDVLVKVAAYTEDVVGVSAPFSFSDDVSGVPLPSGYMVHLLQLEDENNLPYLSSDYSSAIEEKYTGESFETPAENGSISAGGGTFTWRQRHSIDGFWAKDAAKDSFIAYWSVVIISPAQRSVRLAYRVDDNLTVWRNGQQVLQRTGWDKNQVLTSDVFSLSAGENVFVFKLVEVSGGNHIAAGFVSESGDPISDLIYSLQSLPASIGQQRSAKSMHGAAGFDYQLLPTGLRMQVHANAPYTIQLFSLSGRKVWSISGVGPATTHIPVSGLTSKMHILSASVGGRRTVQHIMGR